MKILCKERKKKLTKTCLQYGERMLSLKRNNMNQPLMAVCSVDTLWPICFSFNMYNNTINHSEFLFYLPKLPTDYQFNLPNTHQTKTEKNFSVSFAHFIYESTVLSPITLDQISRGFVRIINNRPHCKYNSILMPYTLTGV